MRIFKVYDDLPNLHLVGFDEEMQKHLGDEWQVEFYHISDWDKITELYPVKQESDGTDINIDEDEIFIFWNYFWDQHQRELQKQIEQKYLCLINQGAKIKIQIYSAYGTYEEDERYLAHYTELFGKDNVIDFAERIMHTEIMAKAFAQDYASAIKEYYK